MRGGEVMAYPDTDEMNYVYKAWQRQPSLATDFNVARIEKTRPTGRKLGPFSIHEGTGNYVAGTVRVHPLESGNTFQVQTNAASIKAKLRRLRDLEKAELIEIDRQLD